MICPYCQTDNRDDREACYYCEKDLTMLRLIVNKAKHHYNQALEFAERGHTAEAIAELKNTLELDGTMVNAQVVLGTLYAKQEQFEEARGCWHQALQIDHRFNKAHEYLEKARNAEYVYPGMRRMRRLCAGLGVLLAGAALAVAVLSRPDRGMQDIQDALNQIAANQPNTGQAINTLQTLSTREDASRKSIAMAEALISALHSGWESRLKLAQTALEEDNSYLALQILKSLARLNPEEQIMQRVRELRGQAEQRLAQEVRDEAKAFYDGTGEFQAFERDAAALLENLTSSDLQTEIAKLRTEVTEANQKQQLAQARRVIGEAPLGEAIEQATVFETKFPQLAAELKGLLDERLTAESGRLETSVRGKIEAGEPDAAEQQVAQLAALFKQAGRTAPEAQLAALRAEVAEGRKQAQRAAVQALFAEEKWDEFLQASEDLDALAKDDVDRAKLEGQRGEAQRAWAVGQWAWFEENDVKFQVGSISSEDAERAVRSFEAVVAHLPKRLGYARGPVVFYAAAAYFKLGQVEKTRELLARVRSEYPKSYIIKDSMARFEKRNAKELKPADAAPEATPEAAPEGAADAAQE